MQRRTAALCCLLVLLAAHNASALPAFWTDPIANPEPTGPKTTPACTAHPAEAHGNHPAPQTDTTILFKLTSGTTAVKSVCPGKTYTLTTTWPIGGYAMITTTVGTLASPDAAGGDPCKNRVVFESYPAVATAGSTYTATLTVPATATGASLLLKATCAGGSMDNFHQATNTFPIATTGCGAATPTPTAATPTTPTAATPKAPTTPATDDDDSKGDDSKGRGRGKGGEGSDDDDDVDTRAPAGTPTPAAGTPTATPATPATPTSTSTASGTPASSSALSAAVTAFTSPMCKQPVQTDGGTCTKSPLDYSCTHTTGALTTHWTIGGCPPSNACTKTYTVRNNAANAAQQYLHYAATYKTTGYVAVGFARNPGSMAGTDAVIGWVNPTDASPNVEAYYIPDGDTVSARNKYSSDQNWMVLSGASVTADGETTVCFSRPITAASSKILQTVPTTTPVGMNWAVGRNNQRALTEHTIASGYQFNPISGATTAKSDSDKFYTYHGILMALAWVVLAPLGVLFARHRWALGDFKLGKVHFWFHAHRAIQILAIGLFVGGMVIAFTKLGAPSGGIGKAHSLLAWVMIALAGLQFLAAFIRPPGDSPNRRYWNLFHWNLGRLTLATGIINTFIGIVVYDRETGKSVTVWFAILGGALAAWVLAEVVLSLMSLRKGAAEAAAPRAKDVDEVEVTRMGQAVGGQQVQPPMYPQHSANVV